MPFYSFHQNNSGGSFRKPYYAIYIEAETVEKACDIAESDFGVYFDGCSDGRDCPCCGDRWSRPYYEEDEIPSIGDLQDQYSFSLREGLKVVILHANGEREECSL